MNPNLLAKAGQVGDMFGAVGALFSGAAILGLVYTIYLQQRDIEETGKSQAEQMKLQTDQIEKFAISARIQALSFLGRVQLEWMEKAPLDDQADFKRVATYYFDKATDLLEQLGEEFCDHPTFPRKGLMVATRRESALLELLHITVELKRRFESSQTNSDAAEARKCLDACVKQTDTWMTNRRKLFPSQLFTEVYDGRRLILEALGIGGTTRGPGHVRYSVRRPMVDERRMTL